MNVSVFGLGYVGCVTAACLANDGHCVIGVDIDPLKVERLLQGQSPFFEPGLDDLIRENIATGRLHATCDEAAAIRKSDVALICVGTPSQEDGSICLDHLRAVLEHTGKNLRARSSYFVVTLRSTVLPNLIEEELIPLLEASAGESVGDRFGFVSNPEFLREGAAIADFYRPPWTILGESDTRAGDTVAALYSKIRAPMVRTDMRTAFLVKYASNAFHALKVVFGNEIGVLCRELEADPYRVMEIFCDDRKLNISSRYLSPGFAFGGSCLPKDLRAVVAQARRTGVRLPVLESVLGSNEAHLKRCIRLVTVSGRKRIGLVGLAFKAGTDDLRESPSVELAETLLGRGYELRIYDAAISRGRLHGSNLAFIESSIPHIWKLMADRLEDVIAESEVVLLLQPLRSSELEALRLMRPDQICIDFARSVGPEHNLACEYRTLSPRPRPRRIAMAAARS